MKYIKELFIASMLFVAGSAWAATPTPDPVTVQKLIGLGMRPELAELVASQNVIMSNAEWVKSLDNAGTANIEMFKVGTDDDLYVNADSGDLIKFTIARTPAAAFGPATPAAGWTPSGAGNWVLNGKLNVLDTATLAGASLSADAVFSAGKGVQLASAVYTPDTSFPTPGVKEVTSLINVIATAAPTANFAQLPAATASVGKVYRIDNTLSANPIGIVAQGSDTINKVVANTPFPCAAANYCECVGVSTSRYSCTADQ